MQFYLHTVLFAVEIVSSATPEIGLQCNLTCNLEVELHLNLIITYRWYKDGIMLSDLNNSTLALQSLTHADAGEYACETNLTSEHVVPTLTIIRKSITYHLCFALGNLLIFDINYKKCVHFHNCYIYNKKFLINFCGLIDVQVIFAGTKINNNSVIYFDEISKQRGLICYTKNFNVSCEANKSQVYVIGDWYFPNGEPIPAKQASSTLFTIREPVEGRAELQRFGHPSQTGRFFCAIPNTNKFYIDISKIIGTSMSQNRSEASTVLIEFPM